MLPPIIYRWVDADQALQALRSGCMTPSWTHLVPQTSLLEKGISFSADPYAWFEAEVHDVCFAIRTENAAWADRAAWLNGEDCFALTARYRAALREAKRAKTSETNAGALSEIKARHLTLATETKQKLAELHAGYGPNELDEIFVRAAIEDLHPRLAGIIIRNSSYETDRIIESLMDSTTISCPVHKISPYAYQRDRLEAAIGPLLAGFERLDELEPTATAMRL